MHATEALHEADRLMTVCNSCRYCEGLCAVFPAMELQSTFVDGDLSYLANLCHSCGACFYDCQFAPPHEFNVNVPLTMAAVRFERHRDRAAHLRLRNRLYDRPLASHPDDRLVEGDRPGRPVEGGVAVGEDAAVTCH